MEVNRIFSASQIEVHPNLPQILKEYTKACVKANPSDLVAFSAEYFRKLAGVEGEVIEGSQGRNGEEKK